MTISALGIGSGLDASSIVESLMEIEQVPLVNLQVKEATYLADLSAVGQLSSALASFEDVVASLTSASDFDIYTATSADTATFTASADSTAAEGSYDIQVVSLAQAQKLGSASFSDSDTTTVGDSGDVVEITVGDDSFTVEIGAMTLEEIADAINSASDNVGVTASIIQEDSDTYYLTLTSDETGTDYEITLAFEDSVGSSITDPLTMAETQGALDAEILVDDTYTITRSSNTIDDAFEGVTLNLLDTSDSNVSLDVSLNESSISGLVEDFVDGYNDLLSTITSLDEGQLEGDSILRTVVSQIRSVLNSAASGLNGDYSYLYDVGIEFEDDGTMSLDSSALSEAVASNLESLTELFTDEDQGVAVRLDSLLEAMLDDDGLIEAEEDGINAKIESVQEAEERLEDRLELIEARYVAQYSALDTLISSMTTTSEYLDQQLTILSNLLTSSSS
jgi:flagellar hook-associated protein 2